jgi:hypothetical protein
VTDSPIPTPACAICGKSCDLETCKTDGNGKAVHAECLANKVVKDRIRPSPTMN